MIRKSIFALAAIVTIAASLTATEASAKGFKGGFHGGWGLGVGTAVVLGTTYAASCIRYVETRRGTIVRVNVCD